MSVKIICPACNGEGKIPLLNGLPFRKNVRFANLAARKESDEEKVFNSYLIRIEHLHLINEEELVWGKLRKKYTMDGIWS